MRQRKTKLLDREQLIAWALRALGGRAYSTGELREKMRTRAARMEDIDGVLAQLKEAGYLDDRRFAETLYRIALADGVMERIAYCDVGEAPERGSNT